MKGTIKNLIIDGRQCLLYLPQDYNTKNIHYPVVYLNGEDDISDIINIIEPGFNSKLEPFIIVSIISENWNDDFTPWTAPALSKKNEAFGGHASEYLHFLNDIIKLFIDQNYKTKPEPENTAIVGYSLGGLTALYALYTCSEFGRIGSLSGSLWYDSWVEFMNSQKPMNCNSRVYLSLGRSEEHSRNQYMSKVGDCTRKAAGILAKQLTHPEDIVFEWNDGGHFTDIPVRCGRALTWLMEKTKEIE